MRIYKFVLYLFIIFDNVLTVTGMILVLIFHVINYIRNIKMTILLVVFFFGGIKFYQKRKGKTNKIVILLFLMKNISNKIFHMKNQNQNHTSYC